MSIATYAFPRLRGRWEGLNDFAVTYITDVTGATLTLSAPVVPRPMQVFKNGVLLNPFAATPAYTVSGKTITLNVAAVSGDEFLIHAYYRDGD